MHAHTSIQYVHTRTVLTEKAAQYCKYYGNDWEGDEPGKLCGRSEGRLEEQHVWNKNRVEQDVDQEVESEEYEEHSVAAGEEGRNGGGGGGRDGEGRGGRGGEGRERRRGEGEEGSGGEGSSE